MDTIYCVSMTQSVQYDMSYQYKREPLIQEEATRLAQACKNHEERLVVWTLLDTGLRVGEFSSLARDNIDWRGHRLMIYGKGGPYGSKSKRRVIPLTARVRPSSRGTSRCMMLLGWATAPFSAS